MSAEHGVLVIGGGATGCSVARDLALRGLAVTLVERDTLNAGTSGRSHGLLHSGARYADVDEASAVNCIEENRVLRRIAGAAITETGGYFLRLDGDDPEYFDTKREACETIGIETTHLAPETITACHPGVTDDVAEVFAVPDAVIHPSRFVAATAESARSNGAAIERGTTVRRIDLASGEVTLDRSDGSEEVITADHIVNAAGPWAGSVAALAGVEVRMAPTRGLMLTMPNPGVTTVLNRCRPPQDGDIVVPHPESVVCGTTSVPVEDPDHPGGEPVEIETVLRECSRMVPAVSELSILKRFWGVRPLGDPGGRSASRGFHVLDHHASSLAAGMTTVVGGKLTTARLMAEHVGDAVVARLGVAEASSTADEPLPGHDNPNRLDELVERFGAEGPADCHDGDAER